MTGGPARVAKSAQCIEVAGISETKVPYRVVRTRPNFGQVLVCTSGEGRVWVDGAWRTCTSGMTLLTPPKRISAFYTAPGSVWEIAWVLFAPDAEVPWPDDVLLLPSETDAFHDVILGLYRESIGAADAAHLSVWAELVVLEARRLLRGIGRPDRLRVLWEAVEQDLAHPWSAKELARRAFLSEGQLRVVCQQGTGRSPMEQVTFLRMRRAAALLLSADYSVEQAARAIGYTNAFAFSTAFKRVIGMPPSRYRG
jgi:AraC-like DNA-binding protein